MEENIYEKLRLIKNDLGVIIKDATNPFVKATYASTTQVLKSINPIFYQHGVAFTMDMQLLSEQYAEYITEVKKDSKAKNEEPEVIHKQSVRVPVYSIHATLVNITNPADKIEWTFVIPSDISQPNPIQSFGSTATYAQRYVMGVIFGIPTADNEDPDQNMENIPSALQTPQYSNKVISEPQARRMRAIAFSSGRNDEDIYKVLSSFKYHKITDVLVSDYEKICGLLSQPKTVSQQEKK